MSDQWLTCPSSGQENSKRILFHFYKILIDVSRFVIAYCSLEFQALTEDTPKSSYIFRVGR